MLLNVVSLSYFVLKLPDKILDFHMSVVLSKILHSQKHSFLAFSLPYTTHALKIWYMSSISQKMNLYTNIWVKWPNMNNHQQQVPTNMLQLLDKTDLKKGEDPVSYWINFQPQPTSWTNRSLTQIGDGWFSNLNSDSLHVSVFYYPFPSF